VKAYEWQGQDGRKKTFYGDALTVEDEFAVIRVTEREDHGPQRIVAAVHLAPGEWIADYTNTKVPEVTKKAV